MQAIPQNCDQWHMDTLITDLKTENNLAFGKLFQANFYKISRFVQNNSGNRPDAEDLFQVAMLVLVEKLRQENFQLTTARNQLFYKTTIESHVLRKEMDRKLTLWIRKSILQEFQSSFTNVRAKIDFTDAIQDMNRW